MKIKRKLNIFKLYEYKKEQSTASKKSKKIHEMKVYNKEERISFLRTKNS